MLIRSQFFWRTYLSYLALFVISIFTLVMLLTNSARRNEIVAIDNNLNDQAELLALSVVNYSLNLDYQSIRDEVAQFSEISGSRFTVIDANGVVLADSHESPFRMENHLRRPEVQEALLRGSGLAMRYSQTLEQDFRYYALPVYSDESLVGIVRTAKSFSDIAQEIREQQLIIINYASYIVFVGLLLAFYLAARQALVVDKMTEVAGIISDGDYESRASVNNALGLGRLAQAINELARNSAKRVSLITADRNRLATIFTGMVEGVIDVDEEQRIIHINEAAAKMLNVNSASCTGSLVWEAIRDNQIVVAIEQAITAQAVIKTQASFSRHAAQVTPEGVIDIYAASLSDDSGKPIGAVVVLHDVTEIKNLERIRTDFVANASHELKTPITAIRGLSETILEDEAFDRDTAYRFMDRIHAQSLRLSELVADLITLSRLESAQVKAEFSIVNLCDLVKQGVKRAETARDAKKQALLLDLPSEAVKVFGDMGNLAQLIDNLLGNAIKYTPEEGEIRVMLSLDNAEVVLDVIDNGIGIGPQYLQRVFERFYRVDKARSQSLGGTGLGLSIVKNIAEKHGGAVVVDSQIGNGSTFSFRMPCAQK